MTDSAHDQAKELGRKSAEATHRKHDAANARHHREYFSRWLNSQSESDRKGLVEIFNAAYQEEASYYIGRY